MQSFQPSVHTTTDVVRLAIIPLTASSCSSYAQLVNKGEKVLPKKMVTHNWSNLFRDLLASVISKALGEHTFEFVAELLSDKVGVEALEKMLVCTVAFKKRIGFVLSQSISMQEFVEQTRLELLIR